MNNVQLYWRLRCHPQDSDLRSALLLEQAAHCFINMKQPMVRKYSLHMILAGHRFSKAAQVNESCISSSLCSSCTKAFLYWVKTIALSMGLLGNSISFSYWVMGKVQRNCWHSLSFSIHVSLWRIHNDHDRDRVQMGYMILCGSLYITPQSGQGRDFIAPYCSGLDPCSVLVPVQLRVNAPLNHITECYHLERQLSNRFGRQITDID